MMEEAKRLPLFLLLLLLLPASDFCYMASNHLLLPIPLSTFSLWRHSFLMSGLYGEAWGAVT
jgi:hypothetical protein